MTGRVGVPSSTLRELVSAFESGDRLCGICDHVIEENEAVEVDHVIAVSNGGNDELDNLRIVHYDCNRRRWARGRQPPRLLSYTHPALVGPFPHRMTLDLTTSAHRALRLASVEANVPASAILRVLLAIYLDDEGVSQGVNERARVAEASELRSRRLS